MKDFQVFEKVNSCRAYLGMQVRLNGKEGWMKQEFPDQYFIVGLQFDGLNTNVTIADDIDGKNSTDGFSLFELVPIEIPKHV